MDYCESYSSCVNWPEEEAFARSVAIASRVESWLKYDPDIVYAALPDDYAEADYGEAYLVEYVESELAKRAEREIDQSPGRRY